VLNKQQTTTTKRTNHDRINSITGESTPLLARMSRTGRQALGLRDEPMLVPPPYMMAEKPPAYQLGGGSGGGGGAPSGGSGNTAGGSPSDECAL
jgi:hypothetical protein